MQSWVHFGVLGEGPQSERVGVLLMHTCKKANFADVEDVTVGAGQPRL